MRESKGLNGDDSYIGRKQKSFGVRRGRVAELGGDTDAEVRGELSYLDLRFINHRDQIVIK